jgi:hypothetical protein
MPDMSVLWRSATIILNAQGVYIKHGYAVLVRLSTHMSEVSGLCYTVLL